jgi:hypothetical protein
MEYVLDYGDEEDWDDEVSASDKSSKDCSDDEDSNKEEESEIEEEDAANTVETPPHHGVLPDHQWAVRGQGAEYLTSPKDCEEPKSNKQETAMAELEREVRLSGTESQMDSIGLCEWEVHNSQSLIVGRDVYEKPGGRRSVDRQIDNSRDTSTSSLELESDARRSELKSGAESVQSH